MILALCLCLKMTHKKEEEFLDETLGVLSKDYLYTLSRYKKILKERNTALSQSEYDRDVLAVLTKELIKCDFIIAKQKIWPCRKTEYACR